MPPKKQSLLDRPPSNASYDGMTVGPPKTPTPNCGPPTTPSPVPISRHMSRPNSAVASIDQVMDLRASPASSSHSHELLMTPVKKNSMYHADLGNRSENEISSSVPAGNGHLAGDWTFEMSS